MGEGRAIHMKVEKRRYRIKGFRDEPAVSKVRVLLTPADPVTPTKKLGFRDMVKDPQAAAQQMLGQQMSQIINDSFSISTEEYLAKKYLVGEYVTVTIERE